MATVFFDVGFLVGEDLAAAFFAEGCLAAVVLGAVLGAVLDVVLRAAFFGTSLGAATVLGVGCGLAAPSLRRTG
ncbi:MAG: hypothetical protein RLY60_841, partial [Pseudomonadota bacterium]